MVTVTTVLKAVSLFVAEFISSITDWFQTKPAWANLEVLEETELKTTGGGKSETDPNCIHSLLCGNICKTDQKLNSWCLS